MPEAQGDLPGQGFIEGHGFLAENVAQIDLIHPLEDKVARVQKSTTPVNNIYDRFSGGQGFRPHVIEAILPVLITWGKVYFERILCYSGLLKMIWAKYERPSRD